MHAKPHGFEPGINFFLVNRAGEENTEYPLQSSSNRQTRMEIAAKVEPGDVIKLANALETLIKDRELRVSMGEEGLKKIQDYSLDKILGVMAGIYDRFL